MIHWVRSYQMNPPITISDIFDYVTIKFKSSNIVRKGMEELQANK